MNVSSVKNLNGEVLSAVQDATLTYVVQSNSAQWGQGGEFPDSAYNAITSYQQNSGTYLTDNDIVNKLDISAFTAWSAQEFENDYELSAGEGVRFYEDNELKITRIDVTCGGGGAISSYTTEWSDDVSPYGDDVINKLNEKFISAFISNSADKSKYAETVNETYLENKGYARNLTSEYGTIYVINKNIFESTNSAIVRTCNEGFVSSFEGQTLGIEGEEIATYSWDKSLPNTIITLGMGFSNGNNHILTYSANTNLTGEIVLPLGKIPQTINIPNATEFKISANRSIIVNSAVVSAADQFETTVGELAWASALPTYEYDSTNKISAINGSALAGGGDDTFYIYPGKTTDKEISENSGKDLKLYNSANNVFLDFAGKSTLSKYTMFSFKEITGTQANQNTVQHLRLRVYPNATSACKLYDTNTVNLLDSNSTVSTAQTAYYDVDGNSLTQTHSELTALNYFVQSNSANWGGGSSPAGSSNVLFHLYSNNDPNYGGSYTSYISVAKDLYFEASVSLQESNPSDIIIIRGGSEIGRAFWSQVSSDGIYNYFTAYYNNHDGSEISLQNNGNNYQCYVSADGLKTNAFEQRSYYCKTNDTIKINVQGYNVTGNIIGLHQGNGTTLTSFTGSLSNFTAKGYDQYNTDIGSEDYNQANSYDISAEFGGGGSTVASGDVFPPTNNLEPQTTYYLGWNANNGGLFWYHP